MAAREKFVAHARSLIGTRWRHRGRKPWAVDCLGLIALSAKAAGLEVLDETRYGREPWDDRLRTIFRERTGLPVPSAEWRPGDIALIRFHENEPAHCAIIADHPQGGLTIIHVHNLHGVVEHGLRGPWLERVVEVYRPPFREED